MNESGTATGTADPLPEATSAPRTIGRYAVTQRLGAGGMGVVWAAHDPDLNRKVAVKVLRAGSGTDADRRGQMRLVREAQAMARLSHPNVVQVHDAGVDDGKVYVAMEFVDGLTAAQWLDRESRSWREVVRLFVEAGRGLTAAHAVGLVHRDFKPSNVLVGEDGRVRVADFGLASSAMGESLDVVIAGGSVTQSTELTSRGSMIGTPRYMSPEQRRGETAGPAADQFSFCVALHEALFGSRPYPSATRERRELHEDDYRPPRSTLGIPRAVTDAIRRGLRVDPKERFPDLASLLGRLEGATQSLRRRAQFSVVAALVVGSTVLGWTVAAAGPSCDTSEATMADLWGDARRANLEAVLEADVAAVLGSIDRYAEAWVEAGRQTCEAHSDGMLAEPVFEASVGCLEDRRAALGRLLTLLEAGEVETRSQAAVAAAKLPTIAECRDTSSLQAIHEADGALAEVAADLRRRALLATVSHHSGRIDAALVELRAVSEEAERTGHPPIIAETNLAAGRLAMDRGDWRSAWDELSAASSNAIASGRDLVAAEAEARMMFVAVQLEDDPIRALDHERVAVALTQRAGDPAWIRALVHNNAGAVHGIVGARAEAEEQFQRALTLSSGSRRVDPLDRAGYALNLALVTADPAARDALFERSAGEVEAAVGREHYQWLDHIVTWAMYTAEPRVALERLEPVCPQLAARKHDDPMRAYDCFVRQAAVHDALGQSSSAAAAARRGQAVLAGLDKPPMVALRRSAHAYAALLSGDLEQAIEHADAAAAILEPRKELPWVARTLAELGVLRARAADGLGTRSEAELQQAVEGLKVAAAATEDQGPHLRLAKAEALLKRWSTP